MAATVLGLYSGALRIIKQRPLSTVTDDVEARYLLDNVYTDAVNICLEAGNWNFAGRTVAIDSDADLDPSFGFSYIMDKPSDWVRTVSIAGNGEFYPVLGPGEYVDEGAYWHANVDPLYVRYISNGTEYGLNLSLWTRSFTLLVEHELADRIAPHLTSMGAAELRELERKKGTALRFAKSMDAQGQAPDRKAVGRLVMARTGNITSRSQRRAE